MVDKELLQLIDTPDTLKDENFSKAANLFEYLLKNKLDAVKANNDALMTLEDEDDFEQIDEATNTQRNKLDVKLKQLTNGCTRKSPWKKVLAATEQSIDAKMK